MVEMPVPFWAVTAGLFGAMIGSFLNVMIYRLPRESLSVSRPKRSFCLHCGGSIPWFDNIPLLSWFLLNGKCRWCGIAVSLRYPLVEAITAFLFVALTLARIEEILPWGPDSLSALGVYLVCLCLVTLALVVTFIDIDFQIIPNEITYTGMVLAPPVCALLPALQEGSYLYRECLLPHMSAHGAAFLSSLVGASVGGGVLWIIGFLGKCILKREALGLGDVKLMCFVGGVFGYEGVLIVFIIGCALGSLIGLPYRILTGRQEIPFGPFLSMGAVLMVFFGEEIRYFLSETWPDWVRTTLF